MAGKPIEIQIDAETRGAEKGIENVADSLDTAAKKLRELEAEAKDTGNGLEKYFGSAADEVERELRDLQKKGENAFEGIDDSAKDAAKVIDRDLTDALKDVGKASKKAGDDIGDDIKRGTREAGEGLGTFKDEARETARESAASFSGTADDIADSFQEVAANALSGFGPIGAAAGIALAAGFGTLYSRIQGDTEKAKEAVSSMYQDMLESGADFLTKEHVAEQIKLIYDGADDAAIKIKELRELATTADIPEPLLARALVGDKAAREEIATAISSQRLKINEALDEATAKGGNLAPTLAPAIEALLDIERKVAGTAEGFTEAQRNADAARAAINGVTGATQGAASSAEDARSKYDGLGRKISEIPVNKTVTVRVEADLSAAQRAIKRMTDGSYTVTVRGRPVGMRYE